MKIRRLRKFRKPGTGELITFESKQYYVTDDGQVYDGDRHRYVAQWDNGHDYLHLNLRDDNGQRQKVKVHCLVASVFIRLMEQGQQAHHIDKNRKNNIPSNLKIISASEHQRQHVLENWTAGQIKTKNVGSDYRPARQVAQLDMDGHLIHVWPSTCEAGRNGSNQGNVAACCRGCFNRPGNNVYKGFKWMWLEDYQRAKQSVSAAPVQLELNFTDE